MDTILSIFVPIHKEGHKFIGIFAVAAVLAILADSTFFITVTVILTVWCVYFFRDPDRITPQK